MMGQKRSRDSRDSSSACVQRGLPSYGTSRDSLSALGQKNLFSDAYIRLVKIAAVAQALLIFGPSTAQVGPLSGPQEWYANLNLA
jgi:hypothetical protein